MKLVIEIPEEQKKMVDAIMDLPPQVENDLVSAIRHGKPLDSVLGKIRAEIMGKYRIILKNTPEDDWAVRWNDCVDEIIEIIDKYRKSTIVNDSQEIVKAEVDLVKVEGKE